jgi:hypothetical protein
MSESGLKSEWTGGTSLVGPMKLRIDYLAITLDIL